jgi:hypothetical protein
MVKPEAEDAVKGEEENLTTTAAKESAVVSDEEIKKIVGFAIAENPLVYKRLADI